MLMAMQLRPDGGDVEHGPWFWALISRVKLTLTPAYHILITYPKHHGLIFAHVTNSALLPVL